MKKTLIIASTSLIIAVALTLITTQQTTASSITLNNSFQLVTQNSAIVNSNFPTFPPIFLKTPKSSARPSATVKPSPTQTPKVTATAQAQSNTKQRYTDQIIDLVNAERSKKGLKPVSKNEKLTDAAQKYANDMSSANFFSHTGKDGSSFSQRIKNAGYTNYKWIAENIAAGQTTPKEAMTGWMNSSGHRANILNTNASEIGVGYATNKSSDYKNYWVQEFGSK
jgi:uncharacterized protein YkwD